MPKPSNLTKGYFIAFTATAIWSTTAIFIRYLTVEYNLPPLVLAFWRDLFAGIALACLTLAIRPQLLIPTRSGVGFLFLYGFVLMLFNSTWTISVYLNGAAVSTVLAYSSGAFTAVLGRWLFRESLNRFKILAVILSLAGCILVSGAYDPHAWRANLLGVAAGLLSGLMMSGYSLMGRKAGLIKMHPLTCLTCSFLLASIFLGILNLLPLPRGTIAGDFLHLGSATAGWLVLILLAVGPTIGGYGLYTASLQILPASVANLIATLEPALTAVLAFFVLSETLTEVQLTGSVLILTGVIVLRWVEGESPDPMPQPTG